MSTAGGGDIRFHVANRAATHLGRNLYSTTPPALAELVANSYDAYATDVYVTIKKDVDHIVVADNGMGMDLEALNRKYAAVGKRKSRESAPTGFSQRPQMGQKGIGKLASFSLGDEYEVYTKAGAGGSWLHFSVQYDQLISDDTEYIVKSEECELPAYLDHYSHFEHGFITVIHMLRRGVTWQTEESLKAQLSRRFYVRSNLDDFNLHLNGEKVDLSRNDYYGSMDYATYVGFSADEIHELFEEDGDQRMALEPYNMEAIKDPTRREALKALVGASGLKGWIGTVEQPRQLKSHGNSANIVVYINNKIADEDVLKNYPSSMIANQYVVGEFFADYLAGSDDDPITSSRQGLDNADEKVGGLIDAIQAIRNTVINTWDKRREESAVRRMPKWVMEDQSYSQWIDGLDPNQKRMNNRLLKLLTVGDDSDSRSEEETRGLLNGFIDLVEGNAIQQIAEEMADLDLKAPEEALILIAKYLDRISTLETARHAEIVENRLQAIDALDRMMQDDRVLEKAFENHLAENPWMIEPSWNRSPMSNDEISVSTQEFHRLYEGKDGEYRKTYIDICIRVAEERYPVIVELKRNALTSYSNVDFETIHKQIKDYRRAIIQGLGQHAPGGGPKEIPAYFIGTEKLPFSNDGSGSGLSREEFEMLKSQNIRYLTYRDLITNARRMYREHIKIRDERGGLPRF